MPIIFDASVFDQKAATGESALADATLSFAAGVTQGVKEGMDHERKKADALEEFNRQVAADAQKAQADREFTARQNELQRTQQQTQWQQEYDLAQKSATAQAAKDAAAIKASEASTAASEAETARIKRQEEDAAKAKADAELRASMYGIVDPSPITASWSDTYSAQDMDAMKVARDAFLKGVKRPDGTMAFPTPAEVALYDDSLEVKYAADKRAKANVAARTAFTKLGNRTLVQGNEELSGLIQDLGAQVEAGSIDFVDAVKLFEERFDEVEERDYVGKQSVALENAIKSRQQYLREQLGRSELQSPDVQAALRNELQRAGEQLTGLSRLQTREDVNSAWQTFERSGVQTAPSSIRPSEAAKMGMAQRVTATLNALQQLDFMMGDSLTQKERDAIRDQMIAELKLASTDTSQKEANAADEVNNALVAPAGGAGADSVPPPPATTPANGAAPAPPAAPAAGGVAADLEAAAKDQNKTAEQRRAAAQAAAKMKQGQEAMKQTSEKVKSANKTANEIAADASRMADVWKNESYGDSRWATEKPAIGVKIKRIMDGYGRVSRFEDAQALITEISDLRKELEGYASEAGAPFGRHDRNKLKEMADQMQLIQQALSDSQDMNQYPAELLKN